MSKDTMNVAIEKLQRFINENGGGQKDYLRGCLETVLYEDHLTGLPNRMFFDRILPAEFSAAFRDGKQHTILMVDNDNLKAINDDIAGGGHQRGDEAIKSTASYLRQNLRTSDIVCRNSAKADEFLALLKSTDIRDAFYLADEIRGIITDDHAFTVSGGVTFSDVAGMPLLYGKRGRDTIAAFLDADGNAKGAMGKIKEYCTLSRKYRDRHEVLAMLGNIRAFIGDQYSGGKKLDPHKDFEEIAAGSAVHYADKALLRAKEEGKNRIVAYDFGGFGRYTEGGVWTPLGTSK
jgi:diguanylate cyclase (GGDEF)-like protein